MSWKPIDTKHPLVNENPKCVVCKILPDDAPELVIGVGGSLGATRLKPPRGWAIQMRMAPFGLEVQLVCPACFDAPNSTEVDVVYPQHRHARARSRRRVT